MGDQHFTDLFLSSTQKMRGMGNFRVIFSVGWKAQIISISWTVFLHFGAEEIGHGQVTSETSHT